MPSGFDVLVVDDDVAITRVYQRVLSQGQMRVCTATSASEALAVLEGEASILVVITDLIMPGAGALELMQAIRARFPGRPWLQIVVITGHASLQSAVECMQASAANYLEKPVEPGLLRKVAQEALRQANEARIAASLSGLESDAGNLQYVVSTARELLRAPGAAPLGPPKGVPDAAVVRRWLQSIPAGETAPHMLASIKTLLGLRGEFFAGVDMDEVSWQMLIELADATLKRRDISVSSLCMGAGAPTTTALRRIESLREAGLLERIPDPDDRRRVNVVLTPQGLERMTQFLRSIARSVPSTAGRSPRAS